MPSRCKGELFTDRLKDSLIEWMAGWLAGWLTGMTASVVGQRRGAQGQRWRVRLGMLAHPLPSPTPHPDQRLNNCYGGVRTR